MILAALVVAKVAAKEPVLGFVADIVFIIGLIITITGMCQ